MHRITGPALATAAALVFTASCTEPSSPLASTDPPVESPSSSRTVVVDSTRMALRGDAAEREQGIYRFAIVGAPQRIETGDVIVGVEDGGFLRRVTRFRGTANELVLDTRPAGLDEVLDEGSFRGSIAVPIAGGPVRGPSYTLGPATTEAVANGITLDSTGLRFDNTIIFNARSCGTPAGTCGKITFGITSGLVAFKSSLDIGGTVTQPFGLSEAHLRVLGRATLNLDTYADIKGYMLGGPWKRTLLRQSRPFVIWVGGVPIAGKVSVELVGELSARSSGPGRINAGFTSGTSVSVGAGWTSAGGFYKIHGWAGQSARRPVRITGYPHATLYFTIEPRVTVSFYAGTVQSYAGAKPYLKFRLYPYPYRDEADTYLEFGVDVEAGVNFNVFSQNLGTFTYQSNLTERLLGTQTFAMPRVPTDVGVHSGNGQTARAGTLLPSPLVVRISNAWGKPVAGVRVNFAVTSGGGTLSATSGVSDEFGKLQVRWTLGPKVGTQVVTASSSAIPGESARFIATGRLP